MGSGVDCIIVCDIEGAAPRRCRWPCYARRKLALAAISAFVLGAIYSTLLSPWRVAAAAAPAHGLSPPPAPPPSLPPCTAHPLCRASTSVASVVPNVAAVLSTLTMLPLVDARLSSGEPAAECVDGSRASRCFHAGGGTGFLSARLAVGGGAAAQSGVSGRAAQAPLVSHVALNIYGPAMWGESSRLAPFDVWVGASAGDVSSARAAKCAGPIDEEPPLDGAGMLLACEVGPRAVGAAADAAAEGDGSGWFVTVRQLGARQGWGSGFTLNELVAYGPRSRADADPPRPPNASAALEAINKRWREGRVSNVLAEAGVLVHSFDSSEDWENGAPWDLCNGAADTPCKPPTIDHISCTVASALKPGIFVPEWWADETSDFRSAAFDGAWAGLVLAPTTQYRCAWDRDMGTGGRVHAGCKPGDTLAAALASQVSGMRWSYNEVIVDRLYWIGHLPRMIDAVVFTDPRGEAAARRVHSAFVARFGDDARAVPLVEYTPDAGGFAAR